MSNQADLQQAFRQNLADMIFFDPSGIEYIKAGRGSIIFNITFHTADPATIEKGLSSLLAQNNPVIPNLSTVLPTPALTDPTQPVTLDTTSSSYVLVSPPSLQQASLSPIILGAVIGGTIGGVLLLALTIGTVILLHRKSHRDLQSKEPSVDSGAGTGAATGGENTGTQAGGGTVTDIS